MPSKGTFAIHLIDQHFKIEPGLIFVYRVFSDNEADPNEPIKLVEINIDTIATGSFEAYGFAPTRDVPFHTLIVEVTPAELDQLQQSEQWPAVWDLTRATRYEREAA